MILITTVLAHAGGTGWDELLLIAVPVVVLGVLQLAGRRRMRATGAGSPPGAEDREPEGGGGGPAGD